MHSFQRYGLFFTSHASLQMRARRVSPRDVRNALANQVNEEVGTNEFEATLVIEGPAMNGQSLYVVVSEANPTRVVSVDWREGRRLSRRERRRRNARRQR